MHRFNPDTMKYEEAPFVLPEELQVSLFRTELLLYSYIDTLELDKVVDQKTVVGFLRSLGMTGYPFRQIRDMLARNLGYFFQLMNNWIDKGDVHRMKQVIYRCLMDIRETLGTNFTLRGGDDDDADAPDGYDSIQPKAAY
jgi:hypothetical protein